MDYTKFVNGQKCNSWYDTEGGLFTVVGQTEEGRKVIQHDETGTRYIVEEKDLYWVP